MQHPRHHLHQQGRRRNAPAHRGPACPATASGSAPSTASAPACCGSYADQLDLDRNFTIYDQSDRVKIVKSALEAANIDNVRFTPETIQAAISKAKNQLLTPESYAAKATDFFTQTVAHVYPVYEKKMRDANALDFDDLLLWPALALKNDAESCGPSSTPVSASC